MGKIREIWNGENGGFFKYATAVTIVFLGVILFFGQNSVWRWVRAEIELKRQNRQIERYREDIRSMDGQIQTLSNRDSLEKFARENFLFAAPEDDVYVVE